MFLNLPERNKRLSMEFGLPRSKSYLSTLNNSLCNKEKSYSTASLKQEFKQFKNKSLSHCGTSNGYSVSVMQQDRHQSPCKKSNLDRSSYINNAVCTTTFGSSSGMKVNDFKKTYLNLDSKLNKTTKKEKDYFKQAPQHNYQRYNNSNPHHPPMFKKQPTFPSTYLEAEKRFQQENSRRSAALVNQMNEIRELNELLKLQNEELKKQRTIDLGLIARQNEIMQKQEELIEANQQAIYINKLNSPNRKNQSMSDSRSFIFTNPPPAMASQVCEQCKKRNNQSSVENRQAQVELQFMTLKIQKMEEEKKLLKNQLHELVYQSEKLKQKLKIAQEKYQKEFQHNQKLLQVIQNKLEKEPEKSKEQSQDQNEEKQSVINRQPYLNLLNIYQIPDSNEPVSIKKDRIKNQQKQNQQQNELSSPTLRNLNENHKNAVNLIKFNNHEGNNEIERRLRKDPENEDIKIINTINYEKEKAKNKEGQFYLQKMQRQKQREKIKEIEILKERQSLMKRQLERRKEKNNEWCQNENIRKYLNEINRQKIKQIDQIQSLLRNE